MRTFAFVILGLTALPFGALVTATAQVNEGMENLCRAPVALEDRNCSDILAFGQSADRPGRMEQRDDGFFVFVPKQAD